MDNRRLNQIIPEKVIRKLGNTCCHNCQHRMARQDVIAFGIRENDERHHMFVEYQCPNCSSRLISKFNNTQQHTIEEMCCLLLREIQNRKDIEKAKKLQDNSIAQMSSTPISQAEVTECISKLNEMSHDEFLEYIGVRKQDSTDD